MKRLLTAGGLLFATALALAGWYPRHPEVLMVAVHCLDSVSQVQRFAQGILWETGAAARVAG
jgi:hypothetical protein